MHRQQEEEHGSGEGRGGDEYKPLGVHSTVRVCRSVTWKHEGMAWEPLAGCPGYVYTATIAIAAAADAPTPIPLYTRTT